MSKCLHGETHDHVICILNLWAPGKQLRYKNGQVYTLMYIHTHT